MKKMISLLSVALMASSVFAAPATAKKMQVDNSNLPVKEQVTKDYERIGIDASQKAIVPFALKTVSAEQKAQAFQNETSKIKEPRKAVLADGPKALYYKPEGTFFAGIDNILGTRIFELYPTVAGSWLNGVQTWVWPNYSSNAEELTYVTSLDKRGNKTGWDIDAEGNFVDTLPASSKGDIDFLFSYRMPLQIASNAEGKDNFLLAGEKTTRPDTLKLTDAWTVGGMLAPYSLVGIGADGMWPLTNAIFNTPKYGDGMKFIYGIDSVAENNYNISYIFGTTPVVIPVGLDTVSLEPLVIDTILDTIQPSMLYTYYEKPMSPLYIEDITVALVAVKNDLTGYAEPVLDSLKLIVVDKYNNPITKKAVIATINDTASMLSYPGKLVTFKLQTEDEYGTVTKGIVVNDEFKVIVAGLDRPGNNFGIWAGFNPYTGGSTLVIDDEENPQYYAPYDPFIMLNGVMATFEHATHSPDMFNMPDEYTSDTINMVVEYDPTYEEYWAYHADGYFEGYIPMVCATELLYDTITYQYNFKLDFPDWAQVEMTGYDEIIWEGYTYTYWNYFGAYNILIWGDATDPDAEMPAVGDEIKIVGKGRQMIFKVVETKNMPQGIKNVKAINDNKTYNVLGIEVGKDYKGVVIRNGEKFIQ